MQRTTYFVATSWILRVVVALILAQSVFSKCTSAPESIYIFTMLGCEPAGRIACGIGECLATALVLIPGRVVYGAGLTLALSSGAIFCHFAWLGMRMPRVDDEGELFGLAIVALVCSLALLILHRNEIRIPPVLRVSGMYAS